MSSSIYSWLCSQNERRTTNLSGLNKYFVYNPLLQEASQTREGFDLYFQSQQETILLFLSVLSLSYICTCAASGLFSWSMELLAFASRQFAPNYEPLSASFNCFVLSFFVSEAPCNYYKSQIHIWYKAFLRRSPYIYSEGDARKKGLPRQQQNINILQGSSCRASMYCRAAAATTTAATTLQAHPKEVRGQSV